MIQHALQASETMESHVRRSLTVRFHMIRKRDLDEQDLWKLIQNTGYKEEKEIYFYEETTDHRSNRGKWNADFDPVSKTDERAG